MNSQAQNGIRIGNDASAPENRVLLEIESTNQGFLIPRVTALTNIAAPTKGLMVYLLTAPKGFYYYDGATWRPWQKPISGTVNMTSTGSTIEQGQGFTVAHNGIGSDIVSFDIGYPAPPVLSISSGIIAGQPPSFPQDFCSQNTSTCTTFKINALFLNYQNNGAGSIEFNTGVTSCNPASGNRTSYSLASPNWVMAPPVMAPGQTLAVTFQVTASTHAGSIWVDWDQDRFFENAERVYADTGPLGALTRTATFTIPPTACAGNTAIRVTVTNQYDQMFGCDILETVPGETEEIEIIIGGGNVCTPAPRQTSCNISAVVGTQFRVECTDLDGEAANARYYFKVSENQ